MHIKDTYLVCTQVVVIRRKLDLDTYVFNVKDPPRNNHVEKNNNYISPLCQYPIHIVTPGYTLPVKARRKSNANTENVVRPLALSHFFFLCHTKLSETPSALPVLENKMQTYRVADPLT